ncbi:peptide deformylase [Candidatus Saccharibacteria bacterium]|nr:peptide deformylase [Candidatus Saccharibacteria bacterium]
MAANKGIIITLPNSHLRAKSRRVAIITNEVRQIIENMKSATLDWEKSRPHEVGVALAAIQIDQPLKIIIIRNNFDDKKDETFSVFINPKIMKYEGKLEEDFEGCLSVLDIYGKVPRWTKIRMRAQDEQGHEVRVKADGFLARVLQHEVDHINGMVFVDHIKDHPEAFYHLTSDGKLIESNYEQIKKTHILED